MQRRTFTPRLGVAVLCDTGAVRAVEWDIPCGPDLLQRLDRSIAATEREQPPVPKTDRKFVEDACAKGVSGRI